jgi:alginate O-acetyltransferase complex protein AlgI
LALYIALFPQLIAGPIIRYHDVSEQLRQRSHSVDLFLSGINRFVIGLSKKVLIANTLALPADKIFAIAPGELSLPLAWLGIVCYSLQIYYDFSGYSDMAIGMGRMFGFQFKENFQWPYSSLSIREFWRRWHISLSTWFRDYLYIPLGGDRGGAARTHFNLIAVFFLCGLWHGASWTFVFWGFYHGAFLVLERSRFGRWLKGCPGILQRLYVMLVFMIGWVFFRSESFSGALAYVGCMFNVFRPGSFAHPFQMYVNNLVIAAILWGACFSFPVLPALRRLFVDQLGQGGGLGAAVSRHGYALAMTVLAIVAFAASLSLLAAQTHNPFIYFRF